MKKIIFEKLTVQEKKEALAGSEPDIASCGPFNDDLLDIENCSVKASMFHCRP